MSTTLLDLRHIVAYFSLASILIIVIPLFLLGSSIAYDSNNVSALKAGLQGSSILEKIHLISLGSAIPLTVELILDLSSQAAEITAIAQIKERIIILLTLTGFCIAFLSCRGFDSIPAIYVGMNFVRANALSTAVYYAVYPEVSSKLDKILHYCLFSLMILWLVANTLNSYSVYYYSDSSTIGLLNACCQGGYLVLFVYCIYRWLRTIAARQQTSVIRFDQLTVDEYVAVAYVVATIMYGLAQYIAFAALGEQYWTGRTETGLIVHMVLTYIAHCALIIVPGRILHILVVMNTKLLRLKQIFVRFVSHEIRSPLNVVHIGLELLVSVIQKAGPTGPVFIDRETAELIEQMLFSSNSAINILNDLLHYEHIEAGTFALTCISICIANSLKNKFGGANVLASQKNVSFSVQDSTLATEFGPSEVVPFADEESGQVAEHLAAQRNAYMYVDMLRIDQVIRNLITNAMKFTPSSGRVSVAISCELLGPANTATIRDRFGEKAVGIFRVAVVDSGVGLSEDEQEKIFGEFTQFNRNELQGGGGSGLGLWISRRIVLMHKGYMGVTSAGRGHGSTFYFELPLFGPDQGDTPPRRELSRRPEFTPTPRWVRRSGIVCDNNENNNNQDMVVSSGGQTGTSSPSSSVDRTTRIAHRAIPHPFPRVSSAQGGGSVQRTNTSYALLERGGFGPDDGGLFDDSRPALPRGPLRLLVVDDSALNCKMLAKLIESETAGPFAQATVITADDGATAVEALRTEMDAGREVHFILIDYIMTNMHGPDAVRTIRQDLQYRGTVIGVTGNALPEDIAAFISSGVDQVVTKPLSKAKLMDALYLHQRATAHTHHNLTNPNLA